MKKTKGVKEKAIDRPEISQSEDDSAWDKPARAKWRRVRGNMPLRKKHGIWVFRTGTRLSASTVSATLREVREDRDRQNTRKSR